MLTLLLAVALQAPIDTTRIAVAIAPVTPHIERRDGQALNFDFTIVNQRTDTLTLDAVELTVLDRSGALVLRRFLDSNGFSPSILTIPERTWLPGSKHLVFNPFHTFPAGHDLATMRYAFKFRSSSGGTTTRSVDVQPRVYEPRASLVLPVDGLLLVYDGHDFYSHHRRMDVTHPAAQQFRIASNFGRYAYDFVRVDDAGSPTRADSGGNEKYYGFGDAVLAPAAGTVVGAVDVQPDNSGDTDFFDPSKLIADPMSLYGNHVVIDHGAGEFSILGHLRRGSVSVKAGDRVAQGQRVAEIGSSGSSFFPHLHYELRTGATLNVDGLPSYFSAFERIIGRQTLPGGTDAVDTGDIIRSRRTIQP